MKKNIKILIIIVLIIIIGIIVSILLNLLNNDKGILESNENNKEDIKFIPYNEQENNGIQLVNNRDEYYVVKNCVNKFYNYYMSLFASEERIRCKY